MVKPYHYNPYLGKYGSFQFQRFKLKIMACCGLVKVNFPFPDSICHFFNLQSRFTEQLVIKRRKRGIRMLVDCLHLIKTAQVSLGPITNQVTYTLKIRLSMFCKQWCDQAAQPQHLTGDFCVCFVFRFQGALSDIGNLLLWVGFRRCASSVVCLHLLLNSYWANLHQIWYLAPVWEGCTKSYISLRRGLNNKL